MIRDALRRRPPESTLSWVTKAVGDGSRIVSLRRLPHGGWHANHALTVVDRAGESHRLVLRRWARPEWIVEDPDFTAEREATVLVHLSRTPVPAPELVAADPRADACDVPALLITRLPGRPPRVPPDLDAFLTGLARALVAIHAAGERLRGRVPGYRTYHDHRSAVAPRWSSRPKLWERALELGRTEPPPGPRCFIHRDYHPENTLWSRGRLTGVVDWTSASWGPPAVDVAHMRWNLALTYGLDAADAFLRLHRSLAAQSFPDQRYWEVVTVLDLACELDPNDDTTVDLGHHPVDRGVGDEVVVSSTAAASVGKSRSKR